MTATAQPVPAVQPPLSMIIKPPSPGLRFDKRKEGLEPVKGVDLPPIDGEFTIELAPFFEPGEQHVKGDVMVARVNKLGHCGDQRHAERMLELATDIPPEFCRFHLVFPETVWRYPVGSLYVPCLYWHGGAWDLHFRWLGDRWHSHYRVVRLRM